MVRRRRAGPCDGFAAAGVQHFSWPLTTAYTEADAHSFFAHQEEARERGDELHFAFVQRGDPAVVLGSS